MKIVDEMLAAANALSAAGLDYAICGGVCGAHSRVSRFTNDYLLLDLIHVTPAIEDVWVKRQSMEYEGGRVTVISLDGLIAMKRIANREQDLADIKNLEDAREKPMDEPQA
jgi:hypothetical protein